MGGLIGRREMNKWCGYIIILQNNTIATKCNKVEINKSFCFEKLYDTLTNWVGCKFLNIITGFCLVEEEDRMYVCTNKGRYFLFSSCSTLEAKELPFRRPHLNKDGEQKEGFSMLMVSTEGDKLLQVRVYCPWHYQRRSKINITIKHCIMNSESWGSQQARDVQDTFFWCWLCSSNKIELNFHNFNFMAKLSEGIHSVTPRGFFSLRCSRTNMKDNKNPCYWWNEK